MSRLPASGLLGMAIVAGLIGCAAPPQRFEYTHAQMGTRFQVILYAEQEQIAREAAEAAFERVDELNRIMSDYDAESELVQLWRTAGTGEAVAVSEDLWIVLEAAQEMAERTDGAFDVTVRPLVRLWRHAHHARRAPPQPRLEDALQRVGYRYLHLDPETRRVRLEREGMQIDLGGIGKGYAADEALKVLRHRGLSRALVDAGGDIAAGDPPPGREGWRVALLPSPQDEALPVYYVTVANAAVATSGDAFRYTEIDGLRYSHIVDPKTGMGLHPPISASVVAPDCMGADAISTAICVLGPEAGLELAEALEDVAVLIVVQTEEGAVRLLHSTRAADLPIEPARRDEGEQPSRRE